MEHKTFKKAVRPYYYKLAVLLYSYEFFVNVHNVQGLWIHKHYHAAETTFFLELLRRAAHHFIKGRKKVVHESRRTQTRVREQTYIHHTPGTRLDLHHNLQETRPAETTLTASFLPF